MTKKSGQSKAAAIEASAKKFTPIPDKCTIYLLNLMPSAMVIKIAIDRRKTIQFPNIATLRGPINGGLGGRLFHRIVVPAGIHELSFPKKMTSSGRPMPRTFRQRPLSYQCHAGDVVFVAHSLKFIRGIAYMMPVEFTLVDPEKAKRKILRSRMLDPGK